MTHAHAAAHAHKTDPVVVTKLDEAHAEFDELVTNIPCKATTELLTLFLGGAPFVKKLFTKSTDTPELVAATLAKISEEIDRRIGIPPVHVEENV